MNRIYAEVEHDWNRGGSLLGGDGRRTPADRGNYGHLATDQIGRERWQPLMPLILKFCPPVFDCDVLPVDITDLGQSSAEGGQGDRVGFD
jgi:hypothetical protein